MNNESYCDRITFPCEKVWNALCRDVIVELLRQVFGFVISAEHILFEVPG